MCVMALLAASPAVAGETVRVFDAGCRSRGESRADQSTGVSLIADARTRDRACPTIRKSLRFTLSDKPIVMQFAGVPTATIKVAIRSAE
jgi:hypothetical protein